MAATKEAQQFRELIKRWIPQDRAVRLIQQSRSWEVKKQQSLAERTLRQADEFWANQIEEEVVTPESTKSPETLDVLENSISDKVTNFWKKIQEEARGEVTQATWSELPFTEESKLAENFIPSSKKAFWEVVEVVWSPIEAIGNLWATIKAITMKGLENDPLLWRFFESSEWDKAIQEAISEWATKVKAKIEEKWVIKATNEAIQEDPALAATIVTSLFKKLGRVWGISKSEQAKIDKLKKESEAKINQFLKPTKNENKQIAKKITPEIQQRLKDGRITASDREVLKEITDTNVENVGQKIWDFIEAGKVQWEIDFDKMIDVLVKEDSKLRIDWQVIPGNEASVKFLESQLNFLGQLEKTYGKNLPADKQLELRQKYDVVFDKTVTRDKITKFQDDLQVKLADSLRAELAKNNPDLDVLNKEFAFNKGLQKVLDDTIERTTGHDDKWLIGTLSAWQQGWIGATIWGTAWFAVWGTPWAIVLAAIWGATWAKLASVVASPKYKLVSAKKKAELADAIAENNPWKIEKILDSIIISQGIGWLPEEQ